MNRKNFARGFGSIFNHPQSRFLWVRYRAKGRLIRESAQTEVFTEARDFLKKRLGEAGQRRMLTPDARKVTLAHLLEQVVVDYRVNGQRSLPKTERNVKCLKAFFGEAKALDVTTAHIRDFVAHRQAEKAKKISNATVNRELACLKRAYNLGLQAELIDRKPYIPMLSEDNIRQGFFEDEELASVLKHLPPPVDAMTQFASITGWRAGEIKTLTWAQVDFSAGMARLEPGTTKNRRGRTFPFVAHPELAALLKQRRSETDELEAAGLERGVALEIPWVFHRGGRPIKDFRAAWSIACENAGVKGRLFHDLRRSAVRRLERASVPRSMAMKLTGHLTESVYRRYAISCEADLTEAVAKLYQSVQQERAQNVHRMSTDKGLGKAKVE